jgi:DNA-binding transcriptional ArsR family regulator
MSLQSPVTTQIATSSAYEFILSLSVWSDFEEHTAYDIDLTWFTAIRAQAAPLLLNSIAQFAHQSERVWTHLLSFIPLDSPPPNVLAFIELLENEDPVAIHLRLVGYGMRICERDTPPQVMRAAVSGDPAARRDFLRTSHPEDARWQMALGHLLSLHSQMLHADLIEILRGWYDTVFHPRASELHESISRDAENRKKYLTNNRPLADIVEMNGFEYDPEEGIQHIVIVPSVVIRPQIIWLDYEGTKWICVPVADEFLITDPLMPSGQLVRMLRALGDERRLRILRLLAQGTHSLGQLTAQLGQSKALIHHHLTILRGAGLILVRSGNPMYFTLRYDALAQLGLLLETYLAPPPRKEPFDVSSN